MAHLCGFCKGGESKDSCSGASGFELQHLPVVYSDLSHLAVSITPEAIKLVEAAGVEAATWVDAA